MSAILLALAVIVKSAPFDYDDLPLGTTPPFQIDDDSGL